MPGSTGDLEERLWDVDGGLRGQLIASRRMCDVLLPMLVSGAVDVLGMEISESFSHSRKVEQDNKQASGVG